MYTPLLFLYLLIGVGGLTCNFDNGLCEWFNVQGSIVTWKLGSGTTQDPSSGPDGDHSDTGNGQYLYVNGHEFRNSTFAAEIRSPDLYILDNTTVSFWYHMNGVGVGDLRVVLADRYGGTKTVWTKSGRQGPGWHQAQVILEDITAYIIFQGTTRLHYSSDIAIDDIRVSREPYEMTHSPLITTTVTMPTTTTALFPDVPLITLDCTFNADTCSWIQDSNDHLDWHRWYGRSPDLTSGPQVDHANTTEYYLLLKGHEAHNGNWSARLYSPHISLSSPRNLTFWYHMNGAGIGNLRLYRENPDGSKEDLFVRKGRQGVSWEQASVNLPVGFYKLVFEADAARHYSSDLAIDDIRLQDGAPLIG